MCAPVRAVNVLLAWYDRQHKPVRMPLQAYKCKYTGTHASMRMPLQAHKYTYQYEVHYTLERNDWPGCPY